MYYLNMFYLMIYIVVDGVLNFYVMCVWKCFGFLLIVKKDKFNIILVLL